MWEAGWGSLVFVGRLRATATVGGEDGLEDANDHEGNPIREGTPFCVPVTCSYRSETG